MNLEDLRAVQVDERGTDSLQALPDSFYRDVASYIEGLREQRARAAEGADNPFDSDEVRRLSDEVETAEEVVEAIYERRVGKVVKRASLAAAGMPTDDDGLTDEERALFARLVDEIEANRSQVLGAFESGGTSADVGGTSDAESDATGANSFDAGAAMRGDGDPVDEPARDDPPIPPEAGGDGRASELSNEEKGDDGGGTEGDDGSAGDASRGDGGEKEGATDDEASTGPSTGTAAGTDRVTLRITRDVGEVFGVDERVYELGEEDVVTLPEANAGPLLDRDAAERLD